MQTLTAEQARKRTRIALYDSMTDDQKIQINEIDEKIYREITVYNTRNYDAMYDVRFEDRMYLYRAYYELFGYICTFVERNDNEKALRIER